MSTFEELQEKIDEENVRFIRLTFFDAFGVQKNVAIMPGELRRAVTQGISFDASVITGPEKKGGSDLFLRLNIDTFQYLPWRPIDGKVCRFFCDIYDADGKPYERDCRLMLKNAVKLAEEKGIRVSMGAEMEFYVFKKDENGADTKIPLDYAGYMDVGPSDCGENLRRDICFALVDMGITPESSHHEQGPGQNEIDVRFARPLRAADNTDTVKWAVRCLSDMDGLTADFSPKPVADCPGNGMHINISVEGAGEDDYNPYFMSGILNRIPEITIFTNPLAESYSRFGKNEAPNAICYGFGERESLVRIPADDKARRRIELRSPDPTANPYLIFTLLIYAGLEGVEKHEMYPYEMKDGIIYKDGKAVKDCPVVPKDIEEARKLAKDSDFVKKYVPTEYLNAYLNIKR